MGVLRARVGGAWVDVVGGGAGGGGADDASSVTVDPTGLVVVTGSNVQSALAQLDAVAGDVQNQTATANGDFSATTIRGQLDELDARVGVQVAESPDILDTVSYFYDDFMGGDAVSGSIGEMGWRLAATGGTVNASAFTNAIGSVQLSTGTATNNFAVIYLSPQSVVGAFVWQARVNLYGPIAGNIGISRFGLGSATDGTQSANGMYFESSSTTASTIRAITSSTAGGGNAADTETDTGTAAIGNFQKFTIVSSGAGQIDFYINDVLEASHTTNIPVSAEQWQPFFSIFKSTGTASSKEMWVDYCYMKVLTNR